MSDNCRHVEDAPAWVLGALDAPESDSYAAHLDGCDVCRAEIAHLMPAAHLLALGVEQVEPPASLKGSIMSVVEAEAELLRAAGPQADRPPQPRRRWFSGMRPALVGGLAAVLLALGIGAGVLIDGGKDDDATQTQTYAVKAEDGMTALATVSDGHVTLHFEGMHAPPAGRVYQVWLVHDGKMTPSSALFAVPKDGTTTVEVPEPLDDADHVLVSDEPPGGSESPTSAPAVDVELTS